jgi:ATPase subunit of ABC transporter with duplicated ATPase domains
MTVMDAKSYWGWGWGAKGKRAQASAFFDGEHLVKHLFESSFGRFMAVVEKLSKDGGARPRVEESSFRLPRVVVVGAESAGKSSLLESITKAAIFPRDMKTCTKMPIRLCLGPPDAVHGEKATVSFQGQDWHGEKEQILARVTEIMGRLGPDELSEEEIVVRLRSKGFPVFELVDLPGPCSSATSPWRALRSLV